MSDHSSPRERRAVQECPICGAIQPLSSRTCSICGALLPGERTPIIPMASVEQPAQERSGPRYDPALGDDDLYAGELGGRMWRWIVGGGIALALVVGVAIGVVIGQLSSNGDAGDVRVENAPRSVTPGGGAENASTQQPATAPPTSTPRGTLTPTVDVFAHMATVTPLPPTGTDTPTPGPCYQTAQTDDTVLGMAMRCGHRDMAVIDLILELNDMDSAEELQLGQTLEIPWPTATPGPATDEPTPVADAGLLDDTTSSTEADTDTASMTYNEFGTPDVLAYYQSLEPTLRPGLAWHEVVSGETIMQIAYMYDTTVETLSQINPEVSFLQCDYGYDYGGENCSVTLYEGQTVRVPVPIPTVTPTPTPYGTATPTPTATATFNAPYPLKPADGQTFMADEIVMLRWGTTGTLSGEDQYIVHVRDVTANAAYTGFTASSPYQLPDAWQPSDGKAHTFEWTVSVGTVGENGRVLSESYTTDARVFSWESR